MPRYARCQNDPCRETHEATPSHEGAHGQGQVFEVICTLDGLSDYCTEEGLLPAGSKP